MVLTAYHLAKKGVDVYLVPMYQQIFHVMEIKPDLVLLNFIRENNVMFIRMYQMLNINLVVLDTEGGILRSSDEILLSVIKSKAIQHVNQYCFWGHQQYKDFKAHFGTIEKPKFVVTGSPRYDFYHERYSKSRELPNSPSPRYVLVPTSFTLANPRFVSCEHEIMNMHNAIGESLENCRKMCEVGKEVLQQVLALFQKMFEANPDTHFVLRPHPFENEKTYQKQFERFGNVSIIREGNISNWLKHALFIIQFNSSTAFEAKLFNKTVISLEMFQHPLLAVHSSSDCSLKPESDEEFLDLVGTLVHQRELSDKFQTQAREIEAAVGKITYDWFYKLDGNSSERLANVLTETLLSDGRQWLRELSLQVTWLGLSARRSMNAALHMAKGLLKGKQHFEEITERKKAKSFTREEVVQTLEFVKNDPETQFEVEETEYFKWNPAYHSKHLRIRKIN